MNAPVEVPTLLDWPAAAAAGAGEAGGKGWQLGLLARYGLPVPDGVVVPASLCRATVSAAGLTGLGCAAAQQADPAESLRRVREAIGRQPLPAALDDALRALLDARGWHTEPLAVRSSAPMEDSAAASFAGIHLSRLNVIGLDALRDAVREVWASLWTPQAVAYRERAGVAHDTAAMAVVIMPLLPAVAAGIAFSCDPQTGRDDHIVIHAHWGLGESLVAGEAEGDQYRLQEDPHDTQLRLIDVRIGAKACHTVAQAGGGTALVTTPAPQCAARVLDDAQALALAELVRDAAQALDFARAQYDIEWVWDGSRFWLAQARPVTAMARNTYPALAAQPTIWSNGNTRDVVPLPYSAIDWCHSRRLVNLMLEQGYRHAGYPLLPGLQRTRLFNGRLYLNLALIQWEAWDSFGLAPAGLNRMVGGHQPEIRLPPRRLGDGLRRLGYLVRYLYSATPVRRRADTLADGACVKARQWRSDTLPADAEGCAALLLARTRAVSSESDLAMLQASGGASLSMLMERLERALPGEGHALGAALMAGGEPSVTARQGYELMDLAATADAAVRQWLTAPDRHDDGWRSLASDHPFRAGFARFLDDYGHRGVYETYWRQPRWRDRPGQVLDHIAGLLGADRAALQARQQAVRHGAWQRVRQALPWWKRLGLRQLAAASVRECNQRELARSRLIGLMDAHRRLLLHIGRLLVARGALAQPEQVYELTTPEQLRALRGDLAPAALAARVADRQAQRARWDTQHAPDVVLEDGAVSAFDPAEPAPAGGDVMQGVPVGTGRARGVARVLHDPAEGARLAPGEILVAPSTDPAWTPLFLKAGGLVVETGGYLSHGAIVAREFSLPAVVNLPGVLARVRDGDLLEVDGGSGRVTLLTRD